MLRELRKADIPGMVELLTGNFPEEEAALGMNPDSYRRVAARLYRWDSRMLLRLLRLLGKPLFRVFVVEADERVVAAAILTYRKRVGDISSVTVASAYRRRGFARSVLRACSEGARAGGRSFVYLGVLRHNAPAQALYRSMGYRPIRSVNFLRKDFETGAPRPPLPHGVRPFRRADRGPLTGILSASLTPKVREILPVEPATFLLPPFAGRLLESVSQAWVVDDGKGPLAFLRGTVTRTAEAGNLTAPVLAPELSDERALQFLRFVESWIAEHGAPRVVTEVPQDQDRSNRLLASEGYRVQFVLDELYRSTDV